MNYLTNVKNVIKLSQQELQNTSKSSWHDQYKDSAWIFIGGLPYDLTEGDIICIFSQYGEVVNINLIRAKDTGQSKGFCFLCYEDQRSTILAVDNFNGIKILNRTIRVDHVQDYKVPKNDKKATEETKKLYDEGCAPKAENIVPKKALPQQNLRETLADQIDVDLKLPARLPIYTNIKGEKISDTEPESTKKKKKKKRKKKSKKSESSADESNSSGSEDERNSKSKKDKFRSIDVKIEKNEVTNKRNMDDRFEKAKYNSSFSKYDYSEKIHKRSDYSSSTAFKRSDRSRSRDREQKAKTYKKDISPSIPKRWR